MGNSLNLNIADPWINMGITPPDYDLSDGWGHIHQDASVEGLMRELNGMLTDDKHEQLMKAIAERDIREAEIKKAKIRAMRDRVEGVVARETYLTPEEMRRRVLAKRNEDRARQDAALRNRIEMLDRMASETPEERANSKSWDFEL
jgi:hypothetical protein